MTKSSKFIYVKLPLDVEILERTREWTMKMKEGPKEAGRIEDVSKSIALMTRAGERQRPSSTYPNAGREITMLNHE